MRQSSAIPVSLRFSSGPEAPACTPWRSTWFSRMLASAGTRSPNWRVASAKRDWRQERAATTSRRRCQAPLQYLQPLQTRARQFVAIASGHAALTDELWLQRRRGTRTRGKTLRLRYFPSRRLVPAGRATQKHPILPKLQQRVVSVQPAQYLPDAISHASTQVTRVSLHGARLLPARPLHIVC